MSESLFSKWNLSKERLTELQSNLAHRSEDVRARGVQLRQELEQRSTGVTGRLRDASLTTIYEVGSSTLSTAADWSDRVPMMRERAEGMREKAEALKVAGAAVQKPAIDKYDELNVGQVKEALEGLSTYELEKVQRYEEANKNRVTILREVSDRLGAAAE